MIIRAYVVGMIVYQFLVIFQGILDISQLEMFRGKRVVKERVIWAANLAAILFYLTDLIFGFTGIP